MILGLGLVLGGLLVGLVWPSRENGRWFLLPVGVLIGSELLSWIFGAEALTVAVGSVNVGIGDTAIAVIWFDIVRRLASSNSGFNPIAYALIAVLCASVARSGSGLEATINGARGLLIIYGAIIEGMLLARRDASGFIRGAVVWTAVGAGCVGVVTVATTGLGSVNSDRPLISSSALAVSLGVIYAMKMAAVLDQVARRRWFLMATLGFVLVVLSQQRTVWIATALGLAYLFLSRGGFVGLHFKLRIAATLLLGAALLAMVASLMAETTTALSRAAEDPDLESSTLSWRVESGEILLDRYSEFGWFEKAVGVPIDTVFERRIDGEVWSVSPHNQYLYSLLYGGVLGLSLLGGVIWSAWRRGQGRPELRAILLISAVYGFGYQLSPLAALLLGLIAGSPTVRGDHESTDQAKRSEDGSALSGPSSRALRRQVMGSRT